MICLILMSLFSSGQSISINGDGSAPDPSAMLDVSDTAKGFLVPRMTQAQRNAIVSPAVGLMVFQTDVNPGFRWWNGTSWTHPGSGTNWTLTGNGSTLPGTNFLGTTDSVDLQFRTNAQARMVLAGNGNLGIDQSTPTADLHIGNTLQMSGSTSLPDLTAYYGNNFFLDATGKPFYNDTGAAGGYFFLNGRSGIYHWTSGNAGDTLPNDPSSYLLFNDNGFCFNCDSPDSTVTIDGGLNVSTIRISSGSANGRLLTSDAFGGASWEDPAWTICGNNIYRSNALGSVGIGSIVPRTTHQLDVVVASSLSRSKGVLIENNYNSSANKVGLEVVMNNSGSAEKYGVQSLIDGTSSSSEELYGYYTKLSPSAGTNYMYFGTDNGSGSGTTYGVYMEGEDNNYFSSSVSIATNDNSNELNVDGFGIFLTHSSIAHPATPHLAIGNFSGTSIIQAASSGSTPGNFEVQASQITFSTGTSTVISASDRMTILSSGNVGIGDTSPTATFTVGNGDKFQVSGTEGDLSFTDPLASITFPATNGSNSPMIYMFSSGFANTDRYVISHSTSFPNWGLRYSDNSDKFFFDRNGTEVLTIDLNGGQVGIGTDAPTTTLEVNGTASKPGGGSWTTTSDARLKDVHGNFSKGLPEILALHPVLYNYKTGNVRNHPSDTTHVGLLAQEVQEVFPEAVFMQKDGYLSLNNDPIFLAYINAIQTLHAQNESLEDQNTVLAQQIQELREELVILKAWMDSQTNQTTTEEQAQR